MLEPAAPRPSRLSATPQCFFYKSDTALDCDHNVISDVTICILTLYMDGVSKGGYGVSILIMPAPNRRGH